MSAAVILLTNIVIIISGAAYKIPVDKCEFSVLPCRD